MAFEAFALLVSSHYVGDFLLQTRWQADNKSKRWDALASHVAIYSLALVPWLVFSAELEQPVYWWSLNLVAHFLTDAVTSRVTSAMARAQEWYLFFGVVGADQAIHLLTLVGTWHYLMEVT